MTDDAIEMIIEPRERPVGKATVQRLLPFRTRRMVGPFTFADLFGPADIAAGDDHDIAAHPHIGLATVTYLFEGRVIHRDSTGATATIEPGAVNWMTAGAGVVHSERSHPDDVDQPRRTHGLQTWVALPAGAEDVDATFASHPADSLPELTVGESRVRLVAGDGWGERSPVAVTSPLVLADVHLASGSPVVLGTDHPERAVIAVSGEIRVGGTPLPARRLAVIEAGSRPDISGTGVAVVIGGDPVGRRHMWWNFVHSDPEVIEAAKLAWNDQTFPLIPDDHDEWIPLPG